MPTPFTHLLISHRLLNDRALSQKTRRLITAHPSDFLLGGIIADARPAGGKRADTHFYHYTEPMPDNPWREMFRHYPSLRQPLSTQHHAFLAGYVAHLAVDEYWSRYMLKPHFADSDWGEDKNDRFFSLHLLLIHMDERDEKALESAIPSRLRQSQAHHWLPFLTDSEICEWRDFIARQLETESQTLPVLGKRIQTSVADLRRIMDDTRKMQSRVWDNIAPSVLAHIEAEMYTFAQEQVEIYLA
ncbi:MAG: zinc dependent phospholipase C family protein [Anaerolineae bacterium]|nr:zinc dependent phospholipase C family protein [Anaerolineae bacterium]